MKPSAPPQLQSTRSSVAQIITFFETLTPQSLPRVKEVYTPDATFKDPFNDVRGLPTIERIYSHMFEALNAPRFIITSQLVDGSACFLIWEFKFYFKNFDTSTEQTVRGGTHLILNAQGRITAHRDYWDAAEEVYEKLPVVGGVMRWLKRRANS